MKNTFFLLLLCISFTGFAQHKTLEITNIKNGKIQVFNDNQRIKIRTLDHKKQVGNLKIINNSSFTVNNHRIVLDSLQSIKKQPKVLATIKNVVLISGVAILGASIIEASSGSDSAFRLFAIGSGTAVSSGIIGSLNSNYTHRKWSYKIVDSSPKDDLPQRK